MSAGGRRRRRGDPVASLTIYQEHPGSADGPDVDQGQAALRSLYDQETFLIEHRAMVVDGETLVVFEVFRRNGSS